MKTAAAIEWRKESEGFEDDKAEHKVLQAWGREAKVGSETTESDQMYVVDWIGGYDMEGA